MTRVSWLFVSTLGIVAAACSAAETRSGFGADQNGTDPMQGGDAGPGDNSMAMNFGGTGGGGSGGFTLDPKNTTVIIDTTTMPSTPGTLTYKLMNGTMDESAGAAFTLDDPSIGTFSGATFTSVGSLPMGTLGKSAIVTGKGANGEALGSLTVVALRKTGAQRDFFFLEPYNDTPSPTTDTLKFSTNIQQVDVAFVMDTTGSMGAEISGLTTALGGTLLTQLQAAIPNVGMAVVSHRDTSDGADNSGGTGVVHVWNPITTTLATAQAGVNAMKNAGAGGGGDLPEAQINGMDFALTGNAIAGGLMPAHTSPPGGFYGGVDFRPGSVPVVVLITDANWHDPTAGVTAAQLATDFKAKNARFVSLAANDNEGNYEGQANTLSDATSSNLPPAALGCSTAGQCCTALNGAARAPSGPGGSCRLNYQIATSGSLASTFTNSVVQAIKGISVGSQFDVTAKASNDPTNAGGVDATKFIKALRARDEGDPTNNCPPHPATDTNGDGIKDTFTAVVVGTPVCFEIIPAVNTTVPPVKQPQFFKANIEVIGVQGGVNLDGRTVLFMVPPSTPGVN